MVAKIDRGDKKAEKSVGSSGAGKKRQAKRKCRIPHLLRTGTGVVENCYIILKSAFLWCASCRAVVHQRFSRSDRSCSKTQKSSTQVIRFQSFPQKDPDLAGVTPVHNSKSLAEHDQVWLRFEHFAGHFRFYPLRRKVTTQIVTVKEEEIVGGTRGLRRSVFICANNVQELAQVKERVESI